MPPWVKLSLILLGLVVVIGIVVAIAAPGGHGPRMHTGDTADTGGSPQPTIVPAPDASFQRQDRTAAPTRVLPVEIGIA